MNPQTYLNTKPDKICPNWPVVKMIFFSKQLKWVSQSMPQLLPQAYLLVRYYIRQLVGWRHAIKSKEYCFLKELLGCLCNLQGNAVRCLTGKNEAIIVFNRREGIRAQLFAIVRTSRCSWTNTVSSKNQRINRATNRQVSGLFPFYGDCFLPKPSGKAIRTR